MTTEEDVHKSTASLAPDLFAKEVFCDPFPTQSQGQEEEEEEEEDFGDRPVRPRQSTATDNLEVFSDVFQGDVVDVTKGLIDNLSLSLDGRPALSDSVEEAAGKKSKPQNDSEVINESVDCTANTASFEEESSYGLSSTDASDKWRQRRKLRRSTGDDDQSGKEDKDAPAKLDKLRERRRLRFRKEEVEEMPKEELGASTDVTTFTNSTRDCVTQGTVLCEKPKGTLDKRRRQRIAHRYGKEKASIPKASMQSKPSLSRTTERELYLNTSDARTSSPPSPKLLLSPNNEVEIKLVEDSKAEVNETTNVSNIISSEARRQRRNLRKGKRRVSDNTRSSVETRKDDVLALGEGKVSQEEARSIFPGSVNLSTAPREHSVEDCDSAWITGKSSNLNAALKKSKERNKMNADARDGEALLHLDTISSDVGATPYAVSQKLALAQQERIALYTSGESFGVGEESSVENEGNNDSERCNSETDERVEVNDYEEMDSLLNDDDSELEEDDNELDMVQFSQFSNKGCKDGILTFNPVVAEGDNESELYDSKSGTTGSSVLGLRFVGSTVGSFSSRATPPASPTFEVHADATLKIGSEFSTNDKKPAKLLKIPPPPPDKLSKWEESIVWQKEAPVAADIPKTPDTESTPSPPMLNYKIHLPKSPRKKNPNSIIEELDLPSHKRMADKIVLASSKAAKKFEEKYQEKPQNEKVLSSDRFFCAGDEVLSTPSTTNMSPRSNEVSPVQAVGELVGGAFSPWKIPEEESSLTSSSHPLSYNDVYVSAAAKAVQAIRVDQTAKKEDTLNESFEVSIEDDSGGEGRLTGVLTGVLRWLFDEVLPGSAIATAFSAFDIRTSTTVQADRLRAIANDDESFNVICSYVAEKVNTAQDRKERVEAQDWKERIERVKRKESPQDEITNNRSLEDSSLSSWESSTISDTLDASFSEKAACRIIKGKKRRVETFQIPSRDTGTNEDVSAANFVGFLQQISKLIDIPSPFGGSNAFVDSLVNNITSKKPTRERKTVQEIVFPSERAIVTTFLFLKKVCRHDEDESRLLLTSIDEDGRDTLQNPERHCSPEVVGISEPHHSDQKDKSTERRSNRHKSSHSTKKKVSKRGSINHTLIVPKQSPSPFETAVWNEPSIIQSILSFLGNPVAVCIMKRLK